MIRKSPRREEESRPPPAEGSRRIDAALREQQRRVREAVARVAAPGADDVHHGRVAARRLRSILKTFRPWLDARRARLMRADLREFARSMAAVREADVRRDLLVAIAEADDALGPAARQRLGKVLDDQCREARAVLRRQASEPAWAARVAAVEGEEAIDHLRLRQDVTLADLLGRIDAGWKRAERLLEREPTETEALHELRLALKHCRYALEPVTDVGEKEARMLLKRLRVVQDRIGEHRDLVLAAQWLQSNVRRVGAMPVRRLLDEVGRREERLRRQSARGAEKVLPACRRWRRATQSIRKKAAPKARVRPARTPGRA